MASLLSNRGLTAAETGGQTSTVGEPSLAKFGNEILLTGNWYGSRSSDDGATWTLVNPFTFFPSVDGGFCCDQTAMFDPTKRMAIWLLQYIKQNGSNTLRIALNGGANMAHNTWIRYDFKPQNLSSDFAGEWFDYNHCALTNNFLYVASNVFRGSDDTFTRCVVMRFPLDQLRAGAALNYTYFQTSDNFSLRCTQGATNVMYFASHNSLSQIRVFRWPDNANQISRVDVDVAAWSAGQYSAPCSDGSDWIRRCDPRMTAGYVASGELGFMWTANARENRPFPYCRLVRLRDAETPTLLSQHDLFNSNYAWAYPDVAVNSTGEVGISVFRGGGSQMPGHVVGTLNRGTGLWQLAATRDGTNGPSDGKWGDYLSCRRDSTDPTTWIAAGYTLQGGGTRDFIEPRYVRFSA